MTITRTRRSLLAATGAAFALTAAFPAAAADLPNPKTTKDGDKTVIVVRTSNNENTYTPKGGKPGPFPEDENFVPGVGDKTTDIAQYDQAGTRVGYDSGVCTVTKVVQTTVTLHCDIAITFAPGTLKAAFDQTFDVKEEESEEGDDESFTVDLAGGTGAYQGAKGTATVKGVDDGNEDDEEFTDEITFAFTTAGGQVSQTPIGGSHSGGGSGVGGADAGLIGFGVLTVGGGVALLATRGRVARRLR